MTEATGRWKYAPDDVPTFLVCTPKYLANFIQGPIIHEEALFESIRYLVLDEVVYVRWIWFVLTLLYHLAANAQLRTLTCTEFVCIPIIG